MDVVFSQADRIIVLDRGRLIAGGPPAEVRANPDVQAVYLGSGY
jgi:branched-chain amino acid transport system ATP-binding protein